MPRQTLSARHRFSSSLAPRLSCPQVEICDALLAPVTLAFLYLLATGPLLPEGVRVAGAHKWACALLFTVCSLAGVASFVLSLQGGGQEQQALSQQQKASAVVALARRPVARAVSEHAHRLHALLPS